MLNKVQLIGRLTKDPEMRYTQSGQPVTGFSLATNRFWTTQEGKQEATDFHDVVAWNMGNRKLAETCAQYLHKGSLVYVEGRLQTRSWDDANSGQKRYRTEVVAEDVKFLEPRREGQQNGQQNGQQAPPQQQAPQPNTPVVDPDQIPFG